MARNLHTAPNIFGQSSRDTVPDNPRGTEQIQETRTIKQIVAEKEGLHTFAKIQGIVIARSGSCGPASKSCRLTQLHLSMNAHELQKIRVRVSTEEHWKQSFATPAHSKPQLSILRTSDAHTRSGVLKTRRIHLST